MASNPHPERTVNKILDTALELFLERGFDATTIQEVIEASGVSKGALYHHFKSKKELFSATFERADLISRQRMTEIVEDKNLTGAEKLKKFFSESTEVSRLQLLTQFTPGLDPIRNSRLLAMQYEANFKDVAPNMLLPMIEEGIADGSITTQSPSALAELIPLLLNLWVSPIFNSGTSTEILDRLDVFFQIVQFLGVDLRLEETVDNFRSSVELLEGKGQNPEAEQKAKNRSLVLT